MTGWSSVTQLIAAGDLTGNGASDLVVREGNQLLLLAGQGSYQFAAPVPIAGTGWSHLSVVGFADMTADGIPDLIARDTASGTLWLYKGTGTGTFGDATTRVRIGSGFTDRAHWLSQPRRDGVDVRPARDRAARRACARTLS